MCQLEFADDVAVISRYRVPSALSFYIGQEEPLNSVLCIFKMGPQMAYFRAFFEDYRS